MTTGRTPLQGTALCRPGRCDVRRAPLAPVAPGQRPTPTALATPHVQIDGDALLLSRLSDIILRGGKITTAAACPQAVATLRANGFACAPNCSRYAEELVDARFVFSPFGNGHNNRDWEVTAVNPNSDPNPTLP